MARCAPWILVFALALGCSESESTDTPCEGEQCTDPMMPTPDVDASIPDAAAPEPDAGAGVASLSPERFEFTYVAPGDQQEQTVALTNSGDAPLVLRELAGAFSTEYRLHWQHGRPALPLAEQEVGISDGENSFPETIEVMPGALVLFTLVYSPTEDGVRGGSFALTADRDIRMSIEHSDDRPEFLAIPNPVDFGEVAVGERKLEFLKLTNVGSAIATLEEVSISGNEAFEISIEGRDPQVDSQVLQNPDRDLQPGVGIDKEVDILIRFQPEDEMPAEAEVRIVSNAVNGEIIVPVSGNAGPPPPK